MFRVYNRCMHVFVCLYVDRVRNFAREYAERKNDGKRVRYVRVYGCAGVLEERDISCR